MLNHFQNMRLIQPIFRRAIYIFFYFCVHKTYKAIPVVEKWGVVKTALPHPVSAAFAQDGGKDVAEVETDGEVGHHFGICLGQF